MAQKNVRPPCHILKAPSFAEADNVLSPSKVWQRERIKKTLDFHDAEVSLAEIPIASATEIRPKDARENRVPFACWVTGGRTSDAEFPRTTHAAYVSTV